MEPVFLNRKDSALTLGIGAENYDRDVRPSSEEIILWGGRVLFKELRSHTVTIYKKLGHVIVNKYLRVKNDS